MPNQFNQFGTGYNPVTGRYQRGHYQAPVEDHDQTPTMRWFLRYFSVAEVSDIPKTIYDCFCVVPVNSFTRNSICKFLIVNNIPLCLYKNLMLELGYCMSYHVIALTNMYYFCRNNGADIGYYSYHCRSRNFRFL